MDMRFEIRDLRLVGNGTTDVGSRKSEEKGTQLAAVEGGWKILKQQMVRHLPKRDVFNAVLVSIAKAFADMNMKDTSENDRDYLVNELTDNIIKHYPSIRLSEIPDAISLGIRGKYGEFFGLSVVTFEKFIEQYLLSEKRTELVKQLPQEHEQKVPDLQTQFDTAKYNVLQALWRKMNGKDVEVISSSVYSFLDRLKLLPFTGSEKYDMMADATRELIAELKFKLTVAPPTVRPDIKKDIGAYTKAITEHAGLNDRLYKLTILRAKKLALDAFLNNVMMEGIDLDKLVESKRGVFLEGKMTY